jgi:hypothetical protein
MDEDDRNRRLLLGKSRSMKSGEGERSAPLEKAAAVQHRTFSLGRAAL